VNRTGRQLRIRQLLERQEFVDLESLCRLLETSESTIRRDLVELERQRVVKRVHGGALAVQPRDHLLDHDWQTRRQADEKQRIGRLASTLIEEGQTVILDGGSTVACVAGELADRSVHAITNSLAIAQLLRASRNVEVTLTGGYLFPRLEVMLGPLCERMLASVAADVLVMGIGGVTDAGFSNNNTLVRYHRGRRDEVRPSRHGARGSAGGGRHRRLGFVPGAGASPHARRQRRQGPPRLTAPAGVRLRRVS
jgi:DeoR family fructose operon transcriptional repressor